MLQNDSSIIDIYRILNSSVQSQIDNKIYKRYRYPQRGSKYVSCSLCNIYKKYSSLVNLVNSNLTHIELRREIIKLCPGIGPKQASHFLKNIGYTDKVAIIDRHIIRYMEYAQVKALNKSNLGNIQLYEELEKTFILLSNKFKYSTVVVDQAIWFIMKNLKHEKYV